MLILETQGMLLIITEGRVTCLGEIAQSLAQASRLQLTVTQGLEVMSMIIRFIIMVIKYVLGDSNYGFTNTAV